MNTAIVITLIVVVYLTLCIAIAQRDNTESRNWTYKGQYIKNRVKNLLDDRWLRCHKKPMGVVFCSECTKRDKCLAECRGEIEKYIDSEGGN